ncbi:SIMPL domain-containing protein [Halodesulfovibrio aestuarii]|uniref:SIMPL domain-containing protein n=1 Tax=Halodesulfovibrio aestuarii TaxID=126333 RepID=A0ABV4JUW8_9BACT
MRYISAFFVFALLFFPAVAQCSEEAPKQIILNETGKSKVMPTSGSLSFSQVIIVLLKQDKGNPLTAQEAKDKLAEQVQKLTDTVKKNLQGSKSFTKDFDANVSFSPYYKRIDSNNSLVGYQVRASYSITVLDLKKAQDVTLAILKSGVEDVSPLYGQVDEASRRLCEKEALKEAVERGKERAEVMAMLMDSKLGGISRAVINSEGAPRMYMEKAAMASDSNMYELQASTCRVRVELVFSVQ